MSVQKKQKGADQKCSVEYSVSNSCVLSNDTNWVKESPPKCHRVLGSCIHTFAMCAIRGGWNRCKLHSDVKLSVGLFVLVCHRHNILLWRGCQDKANCRCEWRAITGNDSSRSSFILCGFGPRVMHLRHLAEGVTKPISQVGRRGYKREHSCQIQSWEILWLGGFLTLAFFLQPG